MFSPSVSCPFTLSPGSTSKALYCATSPFERVVNASPSALVHQSLSVPVAS